MSARSVPAALAVLLLLTAGTGAEQLGGAYRGPYPVRVDGHFRYPALGGPDAARRLHDDLFAFWPFWFEHNKEWLLSGRIRARRADALKLNAEHRAEVLPLLIGSLDDESSGVRDAAVLALGKLGGPEVVQPIVGRLDPHEDREVRRSALLALGLSRENAALRPLFLEFMAEDRFRRCAALGLALLGKEAVIPRLLDVYRRVAEEGDQAAALAVALGVLGNASIVDEIGAPLKSRNSPEDAQIAACHAMSLLDTRRCRLWLRRGGRYYNRDARAAAGFGLCGRLDKNTLEFLSGKYGARSPARMAMVGAVVSLGIAGSHLPERDALRQSARRALVQSLDSRARNFYAAMYASLALGILGGQEAGDALRKRLEEFLEDGANVRDVELSAVIMGLGLLGDGASARTIRSLLEDESRGPHLRGYAALALGIMGDRASLEAIRGVTMATWRQPDLVRPALWAVGLMGDEGDVPWLLEGLKERDWTWHTTRGAAAIAIGLVGGSDAVKRLGRFIGKTEEPPARAFAIAALGMLLDKDPVPRIPLLFRNYHHREMSRFTRRILWRL